MRAFHRQLLLVYLVPYLLIGHDTLGEAAEGIAHGQVFNEHFLMTIATIGALCIGFFPSEETEFAEAVFVMLFFRWVNSSKAMLRERVTTVSHI